MDQLAQLPDDSFVTSSQFTKTVYHDEYPELHVTQEYFSQKGKVVIITGAMQGLEKKDIKNINPSIAASNRSIDIRAETDIRDLFADIKLNVVCVEH
ncbi:hypothetical protein ONS96_005311 [Cadophora gregata f. sp. sojae]|nr:hypothetical protein ONS96_005311 [Cadophora gregata f. sp. sojae]